MQVSCQLTEVGQWQVWNDDQIDISANLIKYPNTVFDLNISP